jgi:pilus assembly protein Flp/PilA
VKIADKIKELLRNEDGATAIEYALIAAAMGVALVPAMAAFGSGVDEVYGRIVELLNDPSVSF